MPDDGTKTVRYCPECNSTADVIESEVMTVFVQGRSRCNICAYEFAWSAELTDVITEPAAPTED